MEASIDHITSGVFFVALAFWWHINNCACYLRALASERDEETKQKKIQFRGSTNYPCFWLPSKVFRYLPIESVIKFLIIFIHFTIKTNTDDKSISRHHFYSENTDHTAMFLGFCLGSSIEILVHYKVPLPTLINQVMGFLAFAIEGIMIVSHLHERSMIDAHIHRLLAVTIICSMTGALGECFDPNNFWFIVARAFFTLTQGTWFIQAAFIMWPKTTNSYFLYNSVSHDSTSLLIISYITHLAGNTFILIFLYLLVNKFISASIKPTNNPIEDDELIGEYKLAINECKLVINVNPEDDEPIN